MIIIYQYLYFFHTRKEIAQSKKTLYISYSYDLSQFNQINIDEDLFKHKLRQAWQKWFNQHYSPDMMEIVFTEEDEESELNHYLYQN